MCFFSPNPNVFNYFRGGYGHPTNRNRPGNNTFPPKKLRFLKLKLKMWEGVDLPSTRQPQVPQEILGGIADRRIISCKAGK